MQNGVVKGTTPNGNNRFSPFDGGAAFVHHANPSRIESLDGKIDGKSHEVERGADCQCADASTTMSECRHLPAIGPAEGHSIFREVGAEPGHDKWFPGPLRQAARAKCGGKRKKQNGDEAPRPKSKPEPTFASFHVSSITRMGGVCPRTRLHSAGRGSGEPSRLRR